MRRAPVRRCPGVETCKARSCRARLKRSTSAVSRCHTCRPEGRENRLGFRARGREGELEKL
eukprot:3252482-Pyramimonas_sp.AAC.1